MTTPNIKQSLLAAFENETGVASNNIRNTALKAFAEMELPHAKTEDWKHSKLVAALGNSFRKGNKVELSKEQVAEFLVPDLDSESLVFVNGYYQPELSSNNAHNGVSVRALSATDHPQSPKHSIGQTELHSANAFAAFNTAFAEDGTCVHIAKNTKTVKPIQLLYLSAGSEQTAISQTRNIIATETGAEAEIFVRYASTNNAAAFSNVATEIFVAENASVKYHLLQTDNNESLQVNQTMVWQQQHSRFSANTITLGGKAVRNEIRVAHKAENCETDLNGFYFPENEQHFDNYLFVHHAQPHGNSNQLYRGIADGKGVGVFLGKVLVARDAQVTNATQNNNNILLSETAKIHSKPQLEIYADDVACAHGSTTGQLNEESLFYLRARGISEKQAKMLLLFGFAKDVTDKIGNETYRNYVNSLIESSLLG